MMGFLIVCGVGAIFFFLLYTLLSIRNDLLQEEVQTLQQNCFCPKCIYVKGHIASPCEEANPRCKLTRHIRGGDKPYTSYATISYVKNDNNSCDCFTRRSHPFDTWKLFLRTIFGISSESYMKAREIEKEMFVSEKVQEIREKWRKIRDA